ncbi:MAG: hypothetical protein ACREOU_14780 [Candidatus Eiseniibacteriota bacterium]
MLSSRLLRVALPVLVLPFVRTTPAAAIVGVGIEPKAIYTSTTAGDLNANYSSSAGGGYQFGVDAKWGKGVWIRPGLHWRELGFDLQQVAPGGSDGVSFSGLYVPVVAGVGLDLKIVSFALGAGPTYQHVASVGDNDFAIGDDDVESSQFGAKVMAQASAFGITLEGAYEQGFDSVLKNDAEYGESKLEIWSIGLGMKF